MAKKLGVLSFRVSGVEVDSYSGVSSFTTDSIDFSDYSKAIFFYILISQTEFFGQVHT